MPIKLSFEGEYELEFAIDSKNEFKALNVLEQTFGKKIYREIAMNGIAKRSDLIFINHRFSEDDLTDENYRKLLSHKNTILIINDELSAKRASELLAICIPVETLLKRLLIYVWSEIYMVFNKNGNGDVKIEICDKIHRLYLGELINLLEVDLADKNREMILSNNGNILAEILLVSKDFGDLKNKLDPYLKSHTVWDQINTVLEMPIEYSTVSKQINRLKILRDKAAHPQVILQKDLNDARKYSDHILNRIGPIKNDYYDELSKTIRSFSNAINNAVGMLPKIDVVQVVNESIGKLSSTLDKALNESTNSPYLDLSKFIVGTDWGAVNEEMRKNDPEMGKIMEKFEKDGANKAISDMSKEIVDLTSNNGENRSV